MVAEYEEDAAALEGLLKKLRKGQNVDGARALNQALEFVLRHNREEAKDLAWDVVLEVGKTPDAVENWLRGLNDSHQFHYVDRMRGHIARTCFDAEDHRAGVQFKASPKFVRAFLDSRCVSEETRGQIVVCIASETARMLYRARTGMQLCEAAGVIIDSKSGWTTPFALRMTQSFQALANVLDSMLGVCQRLDDTGLSELLSHGMIGHEREPATNLRKLLICLPVALGGLSVVRGLTLKPPVPAIVQALTTAVFQLAAKPEKARN